MQLAGSVETKLGHWGAEPLGLALAGILVHCIAKAKLGYCMAGSHSLAPGGLAGYLVQTQWKCIWLQGMCWCIAMCGWLHKGCPIGSLEELAGAPHWNVVGHGQSHLVKVPGLRLLVQGLWVFWVNLEAWNTIWSIWLVGHSLAQVLHQIVNSMVWWQLLAPLLLLDAQQNGISCPLGGLFDALDTHGLQPFGQHNGSFP